MRNFLALTGVTLMLAGCGDAAGPMGGGAAGGGADGPAVKAGLWEVTTTSHFDQAETAQLCLTDALDADRTYLQADAGEGCVAERKTLPGGGLHQITRCDGFGLKSTVDITFTGGAEAFETASVIVLNDAPPVKSSRKARRLGPCPAGMSDGDAVGVD